MMALLVALVMMALVMALITSNCAAQHGLPPDMMARITP